MKLEPTPEQTEAIAAKVEHAVFHFGAGNVTARALFELIAPMVLEAAAIVVDHTSSDGDPDYCLADAATSIRELKGAP